MKALVYNGTVQVEDRPKPSAGPGISLIRVRAAGICNTDIEIARGYMKGFSGILGHEFCGTIEESGRTDFIGSRACADINFACRTCEYCLKSMHRHCPNRTVMGILNQDGACAEYVAVPDTNVFIIPEEIPDACAIFIEPLAAALEILDQISVRDGHSVLILGDGKLGLLAALVLSKTGCDLTVAGRHPAKLAIAADFGARTLCAPEIGTARYDIVIEATGTPKGFSAACAHVKPRGTIVQKSTYAAGFTFNPSEIVINEITIIGSRCGLPSRAIDFLQRYAPRLEPMITATYPLDRAVEAFARAQQPPSLKVVLAVS